MDTLNKLKTMQFFNVFCGSDHLDMALKKSENEHSNFSLDDIKNSNFRIKYSKNINQSKTENLDYYFFLFNEAIKFLLSESINFTERKISIGLYNVISFKTPVFNFFDVLNETEFTCEQNIDSDTLKQINQMLKNTDQKFNIHNNVFSFMIENPDLQCPVKHEIIGLYNKSFFKLFSYKDNELSYEIRGKKNIVIFADDNFSKENYQEFIELIVFLFKDERFSEKYIIIKNVLTRYVHD